MSVFEGKLAGRFHKGSGSPATGDVWLWNNATKQFEIGTPTVYAPTAADYLVGTAQAGLSAEIVVGATPGGELGGTWASPTVDATHSGSTHAAAQAAAEATAAAALTTHAGAADPHTGYALESAIPTLASGVYTPTRSAEVNLDNSVSMTEAQYLRVGATVTVSGRFTADPTTTITATSFEITLPVTSNLGAVEDVAGVAACPATGEAAAIFGVAANDTAKIQWRCTDTSSQAWSYTFTFQVI